MTQPTDSRVYVPESGIPKQDVVPMDPRMELGYKNRPAYAKTQLTGNYLD